MKYKHRLIFPFQYSPLIFYWIMLFFLLTLYAKSKFIIPDSLPCDNRNIPKPKFVSYNVLGSGLNRLTSETHIRFFDISRHLKEWSGNSTEALNVDAFDEVENSTWFQNRNASKKMSIEEISKGPQRGFGPDTSNEWIVTKAKITGMAPGFFIKDGRGDQYIIKFDPLGWPELSTGAEVVSTKILYAAGYNVPENYVTVFDPKKVKMGDKVKFTDNRGVKRFMTPEDLDEIFKLVEKMPDGRIRCHASKFISGIPIGSWRFKSTRPDDPNDFIPHEHRREIRGFKVIAAWIQHYDTNLGNTFDSYVSENGKSYVKHYLIDFGGTFGSSIYGAMPSAYGNIHNVDLPRTFLTILTLGFYNPPWERYDTIPHLSVGAWESKTFRPEKFRFINPCEAFANLTDRDGYWGAKLVMSFTDEQIDALVREGNYSYPDTKAYIARILRERRDKIGNYYYSQVNPLDNFVLMPLESGDYELSFDDVMVKGNLIDKDSVKYRYSFSTLDKKNKWLNAFDMDKDYIRIDKGKIPKNINQFFVIHFQSKYGRKKWSKEMRAYLQNSGDSGKLKLVGIQR